MGQYALIFEGPQSGDADTLRKLKGAFIGELNFSIEETVNALKNYPVTIKQSEDGDALQDVLVTLIAAGAKARIDEPFTEPNQDSSSNSESVAPTSPSTFVLELEGDNNELPPVPISTPREAGLADAQPIVDVSATAIPVLSAAQSSLLSLDNDYVAPDESPQVAQTQPTSTPKNNDIKTATSAVPREFSLELADVEDPEPAPKQSSAISDEPDLEIHFETEESSDTSTKHSASTTTDAPLSIVAPTTQSNHSLSTSAAPLAQPTPVAIPVPAVHAPSSNPTPSTIPVAFASPPSTPPAQPAALLPNLPPVVAPVVPTVAVAPSVPSTRVRRSKVPPIIREIGTSVVAPLAILLLGNFLFFTLWGSKSGAREVLSAASAVLGSPDATDQESQEQKDNASSAAASPTSGSRSGTTRAGDFLVDWKIDTVNESIVNIALKITPPAPPELDPKSIVAGKKSSLKVTAIELDSLPITNVGKYAASSVGPARLAIIDDGKALRAVANAQLSVIYKPETNALSGEISLRTEGIGDTPLMWMAERGDNSRAKVLLKLTF